MGGSKYRLAFTPEAASILKDMESRGELRAKLKKVRKALARLGEDPFHPALNSHAYKSVKGPNDETVWDSYVENHTPNAWRIFWCYGPDKGVITIQTISPHPK